MARYSTFGLFYFEVEHIVCTKDTFSIIMSFVKSLTDNHKLVDLCNVVLIGCGDLGSKKERDVPLKSISTVNALESFHQTRRSKYSLSSNDQSNKKKHLSSVMFAPL